MDAFGSACENVRMDFWVCFCYLFVSIKCISLRKDVAIKYDFSFHMKCFVLRVRTTQPECIKMDGHILLCIRNSARVHMYSYLLHFFCFFSDFVSCIMMLLMFLYILILLDRKWKDLYSYTKGPANAFGVVEKNLSNYQEGLTPCF